MVCEVDDRAERDRGREKENRGAVRGDEVATQARGAAVKRVRPQRSGWWCVVDVVAIGEGRRRGREVRDG